MHRFHPPSITGRRGSPEEDGEGIAQLRFVPKTKIEDETYWFMLVTYPLPVLASKAVPDMKAFISKNELGTAA